MVTVYEDTENIFNALAAGANGYLLKRTPRAELLEAIKEVRQGGSLALHEVERVMVRIATLEHEEIFDPVGHAEA